MNYSRLDDEELTTLRIRGELDALTAPELRPVLDELVAAARRSITVDLCELRLIDSSGVGALVSLYKRVRALGGEVRIVGVTSQPLAIFKLLRLDLVFGLIEPQAVAAPVEELVGELVEELDELPGDELPAVSPVPVREH